MLHLFHQKYSKNCNTVKYFYNNFSILYIFYNVQEFIPVMAKLDFKHYMHYMIIQKSF